MNEGSRILVVLTYCFEYFEVKEGQEVKEVQDDSLGVKEDINAMPQ